MREHGLALLTSLECFTLVGRFGAANDLGRSPISIDPI
jgi:hypothetical protein